MTNPSGSDVLTTRPTHTPGPIYVDVRTGVAVLSTKPTPNCLDGGVDGEILRIGGDEYREGFTFLVISEQREANLKLWAAAPDMLAALNKTVPLLQAAQRKELLGEVLAVIAKAEGR